MRQALTFIAVFAAFLLPAQDSVVLKVHFLYGSKPLKAFRDTEKKWFGGILGGHVGLEADSNRIVNFLPSGKFHVIAKKHDRHSAFDVHDFAGFYSVLGGLADSNKKAIVYIPVATAQKERFDSITRAYRKETPYDYAFFGMRCSAAAYDILAKLDILPRHSFGKTWRKIFYPRRLRKLLMKKAADNNWKVERQEGTLRRQWEKD